MYIFRLMRDDNDLLLGICITRAATAKSRTKNENKTKKDNSSD